MATPFGKDVQKRFNAKFRCTNCKETWKVKNTSHLRANCKNEDCRRNLPSKTVRAYSFEVIDTLVIYRCPTCQNEIKEKKCSSETHEDIPYCKICQEEMEVYDSKDLWAKRRKFGTFYCDECKRSWKSGNSWEGVGQMCLKCNVMLLPIKLEPLKPSFSGPMPSDRLPHQQHLCDMCKKLGRNCETYIPPAANVAGEDEIPVDDDDLSVLTTNSSITGDDEGGDRTPVNSDDDENLEELIGNMKISK